MRVMLTVLRSTHSPDTHHDTQLPPPALHRDAARSNNACDAKSSEYPTERLVQRRAASAQGADAAAEKTRAAPRVGRRRVGPAAARERRRARVGWWADIAQVVMRDYCYALLVGSLLDLCPLGRNVEPWKTETMYMHRCQNKTETLGVAWIFCILCSPPSVRCVGAVSFSDPGVPVRGARKRS